MLLGGKDKELGQGMGHLWLQFGGMNVEELLVNGED
jgi:hypothetical protein